jgi:hypothetical protein
MTVHQVRCLNCYAVNHVDFSPLGVTVCPGCGAPGIKLSKITTRSEEARNDPFQKQIGW